jgi:hypothetical protein
MYNFKIGDICEVNSPLSKKHGRQFEILGFIYDKEIDEMVGAYHALEVRYLNTNRKGTYRNSLDNIFVISHST